jgi:hypothetical protein
MKAFKYTFLLSELLAAADSGKYDTLGIDEVSRHANAGTIPSFLVDRFGRDLDLSIFEADDWRELSELWSSLANAVDARRKFGVQNKGICLLMAYALESQQMLQRAEKKGS